jgi:hypothetical protein
MVLGLIALAYLYARHPARVAEVSRVHTDELPADVADEGVAR